MGVGARRATALTVGVDSVLDLLTTYPRRYIDRSRQADLADLAVGEEAVVLAEVHQVRSRRTRNGRALVEVKVHDGTGGMGVVFFNQAWRAERLPVGSQALFFGKLDVYRGGRQMTNPVVDLLVGVEGGGRADRTGRIVPVYPASAKAGLSSWEIGRWVSEALERAGSLADPLPEWRDRLGLEDRTAALGTCACSSMADVADPLRRPGAFDELLPPDGPGAAPPGARARRPGRSAIWSRRSRSPTPGARRVGERTRWSSSSSGRCRSS